MDTHDATQPGDRFACHVVSVGNGGTQFLVELLGFRKGAEPQPLTRLLETFLQNGKTVVHELAYFDMDSRSEIAALVGTAFGTMPVQTDRLHFFSEALGGGERVRDFVERASKSYLGYTVVRNNPGAPVGRSIVPPTTTLNGLVEAGVAAEQIRTAVTEHVDLFGVPLVAVGVPFMQQDDALLRCAHVSAWICHYAAVLRGAISRRETAYFHQVSGEGTRGYPSPGLKLPALERMLAAVDLPPVLLDDMNLSGSRDFNWVDRTELREDHTRTIAKPEMNNAVWVAENLSASICRYLNSGIPVILARSGDDHTQVVVGYLREKDLATPPKWLQEPASWMLSKTEATEAHSDVVAFIVSDDRSGPFEIVYLRELVPEILPDIPFDVSAPHVRSPRPLDSPTTVVVPLPRSLWLSGERAEPLALDTLKRIALGRLKGLGSHGGEVPDALRSFTEGLQSNNQHTVRVYASLGVDFKQSFARRVVDADAAGNAELARRAAMTQLPRFVWVAEVLDRQARQQEQPSVLATLVLDATITSQLNHGETLQMLKPLLLHLPGQGFAPPWLLDSLRIERGVKGLTGEDAAVAASWFPTSTVKYATGRWSHERLDDQPDRVARQSKLASPGR